MERSDKLLSYQFAFKKSVDKWNRSGSNAIKMVNNHLKMKSFLHMEILYWYVIHSMCVIVHVKDCTGIIQTWKNKVFTEENNLKKRRKCGWNRLAIRGDEEASKLNIVKHKWCNPIIIHMNAVLILKKYVSHAQFYMKHCMYIHVHYTVCTKYIYC